MSSTLSRRACLRVCGSLMWLVPLSLLLISPPSLWAQRQPAAAFKGGRVDAVPSALREEPVIDSAFSATDRELVEEALDLVYRRFLSDHVINNYWRETLVLKGKGPYDSKAATMYTIQALRAHGYEPADFDGEEDWFFWMAQHSRLRNAVLSQGVKFPKIVVRQENARKGGARELDKKWGDSLAWAPVGTVVLPKGDESDVKQEIRGHFSFTLNTYYLNAPSREEYQSADFWAGVFAHEMLHNLGHKHPAISDKAYNRYLINIYSRCISCDGTYRWGEQYTRIRCGCK